MVSFDASNETSVPSLPLASACPFSFRNKTYLACASIARKRFLNRGYSRLIPKCRPHGDLAVTSQPLLRIQTLSIDELEY
jgi:hypothetical protein